MSKLDCVATRWPYRSCDVATCFGVQRRPISARSRHGRASRAANANLVVQHGLAAVGEAQQDEGAPTLPAAAAANEEQRD